MSEKYRGPRVVPDETYLDPHNFGWWVTMWILGIMSLIFVLIAAWWVFKR